MSYYVYMLELENGSYYTGYTTDLQRRWIEHSRNSRGAKITRSFRPLRMLIAWRASDLSTALRLEAAIKTLRRSEKEELLADPRGTGRQLGLAGTVRRVSPSKISGLKK